MNLARAIPIPNAAPDRRKQVIDAFCTQLTMSEQVRVLSHILEGGPGIEASDDFADALGDVQSRFSDDYRAISNAAAAGDMKVRRDRRDPRKQSWWNA